MDPATLNLRFRNQIRCQELAAYKEQIRANFRNQQALPSITDRICMVALPPSPTKSDALFDSKRALIYDFDCSCYPMGSYAVFPMGEGEGEAFRSASAGWKCGENIGLDALERIMDAWVRVNRESRLFQAVLECLWIVPQVLYKLIEKFLQEQAGKVSQMQWLKGFWGLCQRMVETMMVQRESSGLSEEENICMSTLITLKIIYFTHYRLLDEPTVRHNNGPTFSYVFHPDATLDNQFALCRINAALLITKFQQGWGLPVEKERYAWFVDCQIGVLRNLQKKQRPKYEEGVVDSSIGLIRMASLLALIDPPQDSHLQKTISHSLTSMLELGASILFTFNGRSSELKDDLLESLLLAISRNRLYLCPPPKESLSICVQAVKSSNEVVQFWAISLLSRMGAHRLLDKLQVMFACELQRVDRKQDFQRLELCLMCIEKEQLAAS